MKPETLAKIKANSALLKQRIASGEVKVCSKENPMPADRDRVNQKWFHESAKCKSSTGPNTRIYHCPVCGIHFNVELRKL